MRRVVAPLASGVLSALGLIVSERRRDVVESVLLGGDALTRRGAWPRRSRGWASDGGGDELGERRARELRATYDLRYAGQAFELSIDGALEPDPADLRAAFDRAHEERYGYADPDAELELVTVRVAAALPGAEPPAAAAGRGRAARHAARRSSTATRLETAVLGPGAAEVDGPAIFELPGSTLVVPPGWRARSDGDGVGDGAMSALDPVTLQVMLGALRAACDEMGAVLVRSAHSANIKERRDASTALFDERGRMVMQAEHIPVHLGAMPVGGGRGARRAPRARRRLDPQRPLPGRHPPAGHHRDRPALRHGRRSDRSGFAASRAHHADVGAARAGQHARRLALARRRGRGDPAHAARRRHAARAGRPDAQPAPARGRPARPAGRRPGRRRAAWRR